MFDQRPQPEASPFSVMARAFAQLESGSDPLTVDGTPITGLPDRPIPLGELRARLLHPAASYATRDAALAVLAARARSDGGDWTVGLIGVLLPGLRRALVPLAAPCPGRRADLEAEMLVGVLVALDRVPPGRPRPAGWLTGRAFDAAKQLLRRDQAETAVPEGEPAPELARPMPSGNPEAVLARAVAAGVLCDDDAELIAATRLEKISLALAAAIRGVSYPAAARRRQRAEQALAGWIRGGFVADGAGTAGCRGAGRPRQGRRPGQRSGLRHQPEPPTSTRR